MNRWLLILALCFAVALQARATRRPEWRDTYESRLVRIALLQTLSGDILAGSNPASDTP
ncbi:MAG TPA: hypothetical protein VGF69_11965 [Thermoanaerobaculia bacterium]